MKREKIVKIMYLDSGIKFILYIHILFNIVEMKKTVRQATLLNICNAYIFPQSQSANRLWMICKPWKNHFDSLWMHSAANLRGVHSLIHILPPNFGLVRNSKVFLSNFFFPFTVPFLINILLLSYREKLKVKTWRCSGIPDHAVSEQLTLIWFVFKFISFFFIQQQFSLAVIKW